MQIQWYYTPPRQKGYCSNWAGECTANSDDRIVRESAFAVYQEVHEWWRDQFPKRPLSSSPCYFETVYLSSCYARQRKTMHLSSAVTKYSIYTGFSEDAVDVAFRFRFGLDAKLAA